ncbi:MAG: hypothetical protein HY820_28165 [Acidobacteria bacterium]|nr:hypothetical protein [Acidobacteriota bacterium]
MKNVGNKVEGELVLTHSQLAPSPEEIESHLGSVLGSRAFHGSQRCQEFLRYVVQRALAGEAESIKERTVGHDVFGLGQSFEPMENSLVRVKATEVRKRLAKYYELEAPGDGIRICLPVGGYAPEFERRIPATPPARSAEAAAARTSRARRRALLAVLGFALTAGFVAVWAVGRRPASSVDDLWRPFIEHRETTIICVPLLTALSFTDWDNARLSKTPPLRINSLGQPIYSGTGHELEVFDWIVGMGDAQAAIAVTAYLSAHNREPLVKMGGEGTFADLRTHPSVLIGAFSSRWTRDMGRDLRFDFRHVPSGTGMVGAIVDTRDVRRQWVHGRTLPDGRPEEDYGIAARLFDSKSGQPIIIAAGITTFGTQSAAEFLVKPAFLAELVKRAPKDWKSRSVQAVVRTRIMGNTPGPPQLVDAHFW